MIRHIVLDFRERLLGNKWAGTGRDRKEVDGGGAVIIGTCRET